MEKNNTDKVKAAIEKATGRYVESLKVDVYGNVVDIKLSTFVISKQSNTMEIDTLKNRVEYLENKLENKKWYQFWK